MANLLSTLLHTYTVPVLINTTPGQPGFRIVAPGLLGKEYVTSPALTTRILASPEFDQLFGAERAQRILEMALSLVEQADEQQVPLLAP